MIRYLEIHIGHPQFGIHAEISRDGWTDKISKLALAGVRFALIPMASALFPSVKTIAENMARTWNLPNLEDDTPMGVGIPGMAEEISGYQRPLEHDWLVLGTLDPVSGHPVKVEVRHAMATIRPEAPDRAHVFLFSGSRRECLQWVKDHPWAAALQETPRNTDDPAHPAPVPGSPQPAPISLDGYVDYFCDGNNRPELKDKVREALQNVPYAMWGITAWGVVNANPPKPQGAPAPVQEALQATAPTQAYDPSGSLGLDAFPPPVVPNVGKP